MQTKTTFVKSSGKPYFEKCKKIGHVEKNCTNKKVISFDSSYMLIKIQMAMLVQNLLGYL